MKTIIVKTGDRRAITLTVAKLRKGGIIIYPTETAYGMGADFANARAVTKIYRAKRRPKEKLLSVIVGSSKIAKRYVRMDKSTERLANRFMPGPLTLVSASKTNKSSIAWRIPSHWLALEIAKRFGRPITATSANIAGQPPLYKFNDVLRTFEGKVDVIIDAGNLPKRTPSTIFDVLTMKMLRKGPISKKAIFSTLKRAR